MTGLAIVYYQKKPFDKETFINLLGPLRILIDFKKLGSDQLEGRGTKLRHFIPLPNLEGHKH